MAKTDYVVLKRMKTSDGTAGPWTEQGTTEASGAEDAVRQQEGEGEFVAVPKRSFQPMSVKTETVKRTKVSAVSKPEAASQRVDAPTV